MQLRRRNERGDTIIEVLLAIAIVSSVLGISYATMNKNILILRNNQERTEASKIAQTQVEQLKYVWSTNQGLVLGQRPTPFCAYGTDGFQISDIAGTTFPSGNAQTDNFLAYDGRCRFNNHYNTGITYNGNETYTVTVRWERAGGGQRGEVVVVYRMF